VPPVVAFDADVVGRRRTGDETFAVNVLAALARLDVPVRVLAYLRDPSALPPEVTESGRVVPVRVPIGSNYARTAAALPVRLLADRPALYHGLYVLPPALPCPAVLTVHDVSFLREERFMPAADRAAFRRFVPWSVRRATRVVVGAEFTRLDLVDAVPGLELERVEVIPYGVPPGFAPDDDAAAAARAEHGLDGPYVVFLGDLQPRKNLGRLLEAWAVVRARRAEPVTLALVGAPRLGADELDALVTRLGLEDSVRRLGRIEGTDGLRGILSGAAALAFPSLYEGFGFPVVEAMACGTPVVASDATALPETAGGAAILVDPLAPGAIAEGLLRVLDDEKEARRLRRAGLARVRDLRWDRTAEQLAAVYLDVLRERPPARIPPRPVREGREATVTASVVSTGEAERLRPCIDALRAQDLGEGLQIVVVCNRPGDGSAELVREAFPDVVVVEQPEQRGFAENHNTGLAAAPSRFGLVLNPDVLVEPGAVQALLDLMAERPACGVAVPLLVYPSGEPQPSARRFPEPIGTAVRRTPLRRFIDRHAVGDHYLPPPDAPRPIHWALGACLLVRRSAWDDLGGFDEGYTRLYIEDIDLQWRMWQEGWEVWQTPAAVARHEHQAATDETFLTRRTLWHLEGMARFARKNPAMLGGLVPALAQRSVDGAA
jgi:glycosyltransferase involved in cell wall biosynthesis/GT2 family glycosyltransferase